MLRSFLAYLDKLRCWSPHQQSWSKQSKSFHKLRHTHVVFLPGEVMRVISFHRSVIIFLCLFLLSFQILIEAIHSCESLSITKELTLWERAEGIITSCLLFHPLLKLRHPLQIKYQHQQQHLIYVESGWKTFSLTSYIFGGWIMSVLLIFGRYPTIHQYSGFCESEKFLQNKTASMRMCLWLQH